MIKNADMSEDMQQDAVDCASQALEKYNIEKVRSSLSGYEVSSERDNGMMPLTPSSFRQKSACAKAVLVRGGVSLRRDRNRSLCNFLLARFRPLSPRMGM